MGKNKLHSRKTICRFPLHSPSLSSPSWHSLNLMITRGLAGYRGLESGEITLLLSSFICIRMRGIILLDSSSSLHLELQLHVFLVVKRVCWRKANVKKVLVHQYPLLTAGWIQLSVLITDYTLSTIFIPLYIPWLTFSGTITTKSKLKCFILILCIWYVYYRIFPDYLDGQLNSFCLYKIDLRSRKFSLYVTVMGWFFLDAFFPVRFYVAIYPEMIMIWHFLIWNQHIGGVLLLEPMVLSLSGM